MNIKTPAL